MIGIESRAGINVGKSRKYANTLPNFILVKYIREANTKIRSHVFLRCLLLGLAQISSDSRRSGNAHESQVVYIHSFAGHRPLGEGSAFDTGTHVK